MSRTAAFHTWQGVVQRCTDPFHAAYPLYGGRGVRVWDEWRSSFPAWWEYVRQLDGCPYDEHGQRIGDRTLDRIVDSDEQPGHYEPGNVRWATSSEQASNRRPSKQAA